MLLTLVKLCYVKLLQWYADGGAQYKHLGMLQVEHNVKLLVYHRWSTV